MGVGRETTATALSRIRVTAAYLMGVGRETTAGNGSTSSAV